MPAEYWLDKADEVRTKPDALHDPDAKATLLDIASKYERIVRGELPSLLKRSN